MDLLDDYLTGVRAQGAAFCNAVSTPPWGLRFTDPAPLALGALARGSGWLLTEGADPVRLEQGDIALVRTASPFTVADRPDSEPRVYVDGANRCVLTGGPTREGDGRTWRITARTVGETTDPGGTDLLLTAGYRVGSDLSGPLLDALPPVAVVRPDPGLAALLDLIATEVEHEEPGQQVVLDRFLDLLLVRVLRSWFARADATPPPGYRALADPEIGHVLRRLHEDPAHPWTVALLATEAGMSRTAFARRFTALVGRPPLTYLTEWRMTLAAERLRAPGATVTTVARAVGYADGFAFSAAFKRVRGVSPSAHRAAVTTAGTGTGTTAGTGTGAGAAGMTAGMRTG
ncbi:AraC family transcriptional regulator [Streptomyces yaizuensis]|uniref:AraC family transcriptional regulator n=1 Tax=Streptomyces yaizuensis TaxID=2989713 RepID=A0ABQ5NX26_9ACTN|nr:AraC family transcriptional regulator [Streptomyces sp. YSPA8]GLF94923.1 AraC family transcriptional regulator [Streptomyces sp. YSPA8]